MRALNLVLHLTKMVLRVATYGIGLMLLFAVFAEELDFKPTNLDQLVHSFQDVPIDVLFNLYFDNFFSLMFSHGWVAGFTLIPFFLRIVFQGLGGALQHELDTGHYQLIHRESGRVVGSGYDGLENAGIHLIARIFVLGILFSLSYAIVPLMFLLDIVKLVKFPFSRE